jgi:hypothetical protein
MDWITINGKKIGLMIHVSNCKPNSNLKQYLKMKKFLAKDNYDLIEEHNFFERVVG